MLFSEEERQREAQRLFASPTLKDKREWLDILNFLEAERIKNPANRCSERDIVKGVPRKLKEGYVRVNIRRARTFLDDHYRVKETRYGEICLVIGRDRNRNRHGYYIDYEPYPGPYSGLPPDAIEIFWKQQIIGRVEDNAKQQDGSALVRIIFSDEDSPGRNDSHEASKQGSKPKRKKLLKSEGLQQKGLWAGTGEVVGCYALGKIFAEKGIEAEIIRSSALGNRSTQHNQVLVFVGSSLSMHILKQERERTKLKAKQRFFFNVDDNSPKRDGQIHDDAPGAGGCKIYQCETRNEWTYTDYALISYFYDEKMNQAIVGLGGISTFGTEQAVVVVTQISRLLELFERVKSETGMERPLTEFEALLKVEVSSGAPTDSEIIAFSTPEKLNAIKGAAAKA